MLRSYSDNAALAATAAERSYTDEIPDKDQPPTGRVEGCFGALNSGSASFHQVAGRSMAEGCRASGTTRMVINGKSGSDQRIS